MNFSKQSGVYKLHSEQFLPVPISRAWTFFSNPANLQLITPDDLDFNITGTDGCTAYPGQIITYSIRISPLVKINWVTEITHLKEESYFVDEQRFGPYKMWHHLHSFVAKENGVLMTDIVHFKLPFRIIAPVLFRFFIKPKLTHIFQFREQQIALFLEKHPQL